MFKGGQTEDKTNYRPISILCYQRVVKNTFIITYSCSYVMISYYTVTVEYLCLTDRSQRVKVHKSESVNASSCRSTPRFNPMPMGK